MRLLTPSALVRWTPDAIGDDDDADDDDEDSDKEEELSLTTIVLFKGAGFQSKMKAWSRSVVSTQHRHPTRTQSCAFWLKAACKISD